MRTLTRIRENNNKQQEEKNKLKDRKIEFFENAENGLQFTP